RELGAMVGRDAELALLLERWRRAKDGEGQVVLLSGEPGIGKSRIVLALRDALAQESVAMLNYFCSPYHMNSALFPVIGQFERAAGFAREDGPEEKLSKREHTSTPMPSPLTKTQGHSWPLSCRCRSRRTIRFWICRQSARSSASSRSCSG